MQIIADSTSSQLIHADRLIIVTNRGPVEYYLGQNNTLKYRRGPGGMVTALIEALKRMKVTWVAMAMTEGDRVAFKGAQNNGGLLQSPLSDLEMDIRYVIIPKTAYRKYYGKISNQVLWFLQHCLYEPAEHSTGILQLQDDWTNGYCLANQAIAEAVNIEIERVDTLPVVMLHDYHLYLAPAIIRKRHPTIIMQQFIHIPWPDLSHWHFLPDNIIQDIYGSLVNNDIIGFQTERDVNNFLEGIQTLLDGATVDFEEGVIWWQGHRTKVCAYPISISVTEERRIVESTAGERAANKIRHLLGEQTIMRVDRIDPAKNIVQGFQAYVEMLDSHPELLGKVTFLAFLVPSRQALSEYKHYKAEVMKIIEEINQKYGSGSWLPIHAFYGNDRTRALAAMQFYDVLLVNPIIDGMNLVAKEGAVVNQRNGILVLSSTAGAFQQLGKASIPISSTDTAETAEALYRALMLPIEERRVKAKLAQQTVESNDLNVWLRRQIDDIDKLLNCSSPHSGNSDTPITPYTLSRG